MEAHAVDDAFRGDQAEESGLRIPRLRQRRDRADFDVTEAEAAEGAHAFAVLVHAGRKTDGVREAHAHHRDGVIVGHVGDELVKTQVNDPIQVGHRDGMRHLRVHREENASSNVVEHDAWDLVVLRRSASGCSDGALVRRIFVSWGFGLPNLREVESSHYYMRPKSA